MIYQLRANLFFNTIDPIDDIKDKILDHFNDAIIINPNSPNSEFSIVQVIENHHDENPNAPCSITTSQTNEP